MRSTAGWVGWGGVWGGVCVCVVCVCVCVCVCVWGGGGGGGLPVSRDFKQVQLGELPADTRRNNNVIMASKRRRDVVLTS